MYPDSYRCKIGSNDAFIDKNLFRLPWFEVRGRVPYDRLSQIIILYTELCVGDELVTFTKQFNIITINYSKTIVINLLDLIQEIFLYLDKDFKEIEILYELQRCSPGISISQYVLDKLYQWDKRKKNE